VLKRDYLLQRLWDYGDTVKTRVLDVHVSKLREKLASYGLKGGGIETVRGIGYKFEEKGYEE
ncbi:MAG TPA: helix-turn-helix domain-containing protein, partial [Syntrophothermus lipocalidus]|nr:helix-turn-helix domain-containing protein [Syntrophothermus lipocalidus]